MTTIHINYDAATNTKTASVRTTTQSTKGQILLTLLDDRNIESVSTHRTFREAVEHGEEMLTTKGLGWVHYHATDGTKEVCRMA